MPSREHALRIKIAQEYRKREPDPDVIAALQQERAAIRIEDFACRVLAATDITRDQRRHLAEVILGGADAAA